MPGAQFGQEKQSQNVNQAPWAPQSPYILAGFEEAARNLQNPPQYYPGSTVAPFSPASMMGQGMIAGTAIGDQTGQAAMNQINQTLEGSYLPGATPAPGTAPASAPAALRPGQQMRLNALQSSTVPLRPGQQTQLNNLLAMQAKPSAPAASAPVAGAPMTGAGAFNPQAYATMFDNTFDPSKNKYLQGVTDAAMETVVPGVQGIFGMAGRSGESGLAQHAVGKGVASAIAPYLFNSAENQMQQLYGGYDTAMGRQQTAYEQERMRQMQAVNQAGAAQNAAYAPGEAMLGVGSMQDQMGQAVLSDQVNRWNFGQNTPNTALANYMGNVTGNYGMEGITRGANTSIGYTK